MFVAYFTDAFMSCFGLCLRPDCAFKTCPFFQSDLLGKAFWSSLFNQHNSFPSSAVITHCEFDWQLGSAWKPYGNDAIWEIWNACMRSLGPWRLTDWISGQAHHGSFFMTSSTGNQGERNWVGFWRNLSPDDLKVSNPSVVVTTRLSELSVGLNRE